MSNIIQLLKERQQHLHTSASAIRCLNGCRRQFWMRYVQGIRPQDVSAAIVSGSAVHRALAFFYRALKHGESEPELDALVSVASSYIMRQDLGGTPILYDAGEDSASLIEEVSGLLRAFKEEGYRPDRVVDVDRPFMLELTNPTTGEDLGYAEVVVGEFDLVAQDSDGSMIVVDHKAVGRADKTKAQRADVQMGVYSMAARQVYGVDQVVLRYQDLVATKQPKVLLHDVQRNPGDELEVFEAVVAGLELINIAVSRPRGIRLMPRDRSWRCKGCGWRAACERDLT